MAGVEPCPKCGSESLRTAESRLEPIGKRRRKICGSCSARITTYEVSGELILGFFAAARMIGAMIGLLGAQSAELIDSLKTLQTLIHKDIPK